MITKPLLNFREKGDYFEVQQYDCKCGGSNSNSLASSWNPYFGGLLSNEDRLPTTTSRCRRGAQIAWLGWLLFLLALISSLYLTWRWYEFQEISKIHQSQTYKSDLKLISLFNRHGDRAPSDDLPDVDKHKQSIKLFWPNGLHNLTDLGKMRSYKLGLALRHMYDAPYDLGYDHRHVLAFTSKKLRCIESLQNTLKGFYVIERPKSRGLGIIQRTNCTIDCLPDGSGSPDEWKLIHLDTESIPTLSERQMEQCSYRKEHQSPLDDDLLIHPQVRALPGVNRLTEILVQRYGFRGFQGGPTTALFSTITSELNLIRTRETIHYADHYSDWVGEVVSSVGGHNITLYDILEQAVVFKYRDQTLGVAKWLEIGPMITSLVDSYLIALNNTRSSSTKSAGELYREKRVIFYSSHDSILQRILQHLDLIRFDEHLTYEERFLGWKLRGGDEFDKFMSGLSMSSYGLSIKFELRELNGSRLGRFPYVQLSLYNQEEARFGPILYRPLRLGDACARLFKKKYHDQVDEKNELNEYYDHDLPIDWQFGCPFKLFRNITADLMVEEERYKELC